MPPFPPLKKSWRVSRAWKATRQSRRVRITGYFACGGGGFREATPHPLLLLLLRRPTLPPLYQRNRLALLLLLLLFRSPPQTKPTTHLAGRYRRWRRHGRRMTTRWLSLGTRYSARARQRTFLPNDKGNGNLQLLLPLVFFVGG